MFIIAERSGHIIHHIHIIIEISYIRPYRVVYDLVMFLPATIIAIKFILKSLASS